MGRKSGKSRGSENTEKTRLSDQSNKIDLDKEAGSDIDLSKNDDIKIDDKESNSDDFGEFSKEIELYNDDEGTSISGVVGVDIVPLGLNISANGDIGTVGVDIGLPGDVIGIGGNIQVNLETGDIIGGGGSIDYGGVSVGVDQIRKDGETCTTLTVTYFGVGVSYQRCKKDDESDEKDPKKEPPPPNDEEYPPIDMPPPPRGDEVGWWCKLITGQSNTTGTILQYWGGSGTGTGPTIETFSSSQTEGGMYPVSLWFDWLASNPKISNRKYTLNQVTCWLTHYDYDIMRDGPTVHIPIDFIFIDESLSIVHPTFSECVSPTDWRVPSLDNGNKRDHRIYYHYLFKHFTEKTSSISIGWYSDINKYCEYRDKPSPPPKEPEPPIPPEDDMSNCCNLEPVMSLLRKVSTAIGTDQLPAMMPKSFLKNEGFRKIPSLAELSVYHIEILDQLIGKFPIELEIKDTDPLSPGDQTKKVVLTNLAESIAELFGLAINSASDNAIQTSGVIKNLLEITLVRQAVLQNYYRLDAILDYLGAGLEEDTTTFNSTISMPKDPNNISEDVADFFQQSEIKFAYDKLANPKDTLTAKLLPIQKAADIIKAKYWKGFGKAGGDYLGAIKSWLETYDPKNEQNDTEWKDKIDKILEEYAKDQAGNIDKDRMPEIQNIKQIGTEPTPPPPGTK